MAVAFAVVVLTCYYWVMLLLVPLGRGRWGPTAGWLGLNTALFAAFDVLFVNISRDMGEAAALYLEGEDI